MKVFMAGGGTGGHIYPALTIAAAIEKQQPDVEIIFIGTREGLEKDIVPRYGYPLRFLTVAGFRRSLSFDTLKSAVKLIQGLWQAWSILNKEKPDLIIGTGGYVSGPIVLLAALKGIPSCIQEQNARPGITNKILARFVKKIFLGYREASRYFKGQAAQIYTGNPIRTEILEAKRGDAESELGLDPKKITLLVMGGSRGARSINKAMLRLELALSGREDVQILHATGSANYAEQMSDLAAKGGVAANIIIKPYLHNMPQALAAADLAVCRAGAIALAELAARGVASILVPYPYATANHQEYNARVLEACGAARVLLDSELTGEKLEEIIEHLLVHGKELTKMRAEALALGRPDAAAQIAAEALALAAH